ncbi:hypothetical protein CFHF_01175 [Caulobacter flavus]|uniref:Uncharacterized protein n=1 Tax=Caulobacter flavus TaxID=1679497 RepID=A0A2N5D4U7_9CAUL|nr:hypothetical protein [Caulobacter flavus]AYV47120.1 hypothetical protein C1707_13085 [Caulobacter flavus]PLR21095.1 hypothetical protein CFHF_01175 [Caulobacter flavus]
MFAIILAAAAIACPVEQARYVLRDAPAVTAAFFPVEGGPDWPQRVALKVDTGQGRYWFLPYDGGTSGITRVASTTDVQAPGWKPPHPDGGPRPLGDLEYLAADATWRLIEGAPGRGQPAPAHIFLSELDDRLRHPPGDQPRDSVPRQFFDLAACGAAKPHR